MAPLFPDYRRVRRRVRRTLKFGIKPNTSLSSPLNDLVTGYFDRHSPYDYLHPAFSANVSHNGYADPFTFVVAMIYLERLRVSDKEFFESSDPADLYLPALVLASKYLYDCDTPDAAGNADWADIAKISVADMNRLEWAFAQRLDWKVAVKQDEFERVLKEVEVYVADHNVKTTGITTYNELNQLGSAIACSSYMSVLRDFFSFIGIMGLVYTAFACSLGIVPKMVEEKAATSVDLDSRSDEFTHQIPMPSNSNEIGPQPMLPDAEVYSHVLSYLYGKDVESSGPSKPPTCEPEPKPSPASSFFDKLALLTFNRLHFIKAPLLKYIPVSVPSAFSLSFDNQLYMPVSKHPMDDWDVFNITHIELCM